ncbi:unnamed protein product [Euphydryas editha]|uniref:RNase H type-1 domain-containing protein n=1 Tax=Euphydryas editha TaxID=104508 RepID=A0AAU9TQN5_EUPED|nr:unnamed protein product [Euphydryas editha]
MFLLLHNISGTVEIAWVKSHVGIIGNEAADAATKRAAKLHKAPDYTQYPISYIKYLIRTQNASAWQSRMVSLLKYEQAVLSFSKLADSILSRLKHFNGLT